MNTITAVIITSVKKELTLTGDISWEYKLRRGRYWFLIDSKRFDNVDMAETHVNRQQMRRSIWIDCDETSWELDSALMDVLNIGNRILQCGSEDPDCEFQIVVEDVRKKLLISGEFTQARDPGNIQCQIVADGHEIGVGEFNETETTSPYRFAYLFVSTHCESELMNAIHAGKRCEIIRPLS